MFEVMAIKDNAKEIVLKTNKQYTAISYVNALRIAYPNTAYYYRVAK